MTDITLDTAGSGTSTPTAKLNNPGAVLVIGIVNVADYQQRDFDSGDPVTWPDGKPKMGKVVTGLVVSATDVTVTVDDVERLAGPGDTVSLWMEGGRWFPYRDAVKAAKGVNVGDVMQWKRIEDGQPKMRGGYPLKQFEAVIRRPEAKDGDLADRCVEQYHAIKSRPAVDEAPAEVEAPF